MEQHRGHGQDPVEGPQGGQVLLGAHDHPADAHLPLVLHGRQQEGVGALGAVAVGGEVVGVLEVDRVDLVEGDEVLDVDGPGGPRLELLELLRVDHHVMALGQLVAFHDLLGCDLPASLLRHLLVADTGVGLVFELVEVQVLLFHGGVDLHGYVHQPEADGARPDRSRHRSLPQGT